MNNQDEVVYFAEFKKEAFSWKIKRKVQKAKEAVKEAGKKMVITAINHPTESLALATGIFAVTKKGLQYKKVKAEDRRRLVDFYDPRSGRHCRAKRPLTRKESLEAQKRYDSDKSERWNAILSDMGLLDR